jgi:hypothetical protein
MRGQCEDYTDRVHFKRDKRESNEQRPRVPLGLIMMQPSGITKIQTILGLLAAILAVLAGVDWLYLAAVANHALVDPSNSIAAAS